MSVINLIDSDGKFNEEFGSVLDKWDITNKNFDYRTVSILGCQSSGKSTLLNLLFGSTFDVMDKTKGVSQTTIGVNIAKSKYSDMLVMDVEGTDSRERGETGSNYERKLSLFSLAVSDILLINLWYTDIGRYNASNYSILKNIFELSIGLFKPRKIKLMFVVRDHSETPFYKLDDLIKNDMNKIWNEIVKPDEKINSKIEDYFEIELQLLPHIGYDYNNFRDKIKFLKERFEDKDHGAYVFKDNIQTDIPADGLAAYTSGIWNTIKTNKELNLPSQRDMLAQYRCDEILGLCLEKFRLEISEFAKMINSEQKSIENLREKVTEKELIALTEYDLAASKYQQEIAKSIRDKLKESMIMECNELFSTQTFYLKREILQYFITEVQTKKSTYKNKFIDHFPEIRKLRKFLIKKFIREISAYNNEIANRSKILELNENILAEISRLKQNEIESIFNDIRKEIDTTFKTDITKLLDKPNADTWDKIDSLENETFEILDQYQQEGFEKLGEVNETQFDIRLLISNMVYLIAHMKSKNVLYLMEKCFDENFHFDKNLPRKWSADSNILQIYKDATERSMEILETLEKIEKRSVVLIELDEREKIIDLFTKGCKIKYDQILHQQENIINKIPVYFFVILAILGFNEFIYIAGIFFDNLILSLMAILATGFMYSFHKIGLLKPFCVHIKNKIKTNLAEYGLIKN